MKGKLVSWRAKAWAQMIVVALTCSISLVAQAQDDWTYLRCQGHGIGGAIERPFRFSSSAWEIWEQSEFRWVNHCSGQGVQCAIDSSRLVWRNTLNGTTEAINRRTGEFVLTIAGYPSVGSCVRVAAPSEPEQQF
jgi:hypothetical protein